jgi:hypothetical protein
LDLSGYLAASDLLRKSPTFNARASDLGTRYRSLTDWLDRESTATGAAAIAAFDKVRTQIEAGTYTGRRFLKVEVGEGSAFRAGSEMSGFGDVLQFDNSNQTSDLRVPEAAHEVSHAFRFPKRVRPTDMGDAIIKGVDEEIEVRKDEDQILREIEARSTAKFPSRDPKDLLPGHVERELSPGLGVSYLENFAVGFVLEQARTAAGLSQDAAKALKTAAEQVFPAAPADQSDFSKMYFKLLKLKKSWKDFSATTPATDPSFINKRNAKCDDNMQSILNGLAMYRAFEP